jgi:hypothetical protein
LQAVFVIEKYYKTVRSKLAKSEGWGVKTKFVFFVKTTKIDLKKIQKFFIFLNFFWWVCQQKKNGVYAPQPSDFANLLLTVL